MMTPDPARRRIPLSERQHAQWKDEIARADQQRKLFEPWMDAVVKDYAPSPKDDPDHYAHDIHTLRSFVLTERKKADLFYQRPEVTQIPSPLMDAPIPGVQGQPAQQGQPPPPVPMTVAVSANEEIVNELLSPTSVDAKKLMHEVLFDVIATAGTGWTKLGYESVTRQVADPRAAPPGDPLAAGGARLPDAPESPMVDVPIFERCYWEYIPPKQTLRPADFRSTDWEKAPWLGFRFSVPNTAGTRAKFNLAPDFEGGSDPQDQHFDASYGIQVGQARRVISGVEIWYRSCVYRDDIDHPLHFTQLVWIDGQDAPAIHQDSPHQTFDARGALTPDSLLGNPIHPFSVRSSTENAFPPSDAMVIRPLERELNRFREQMVEYRDAMILRWVYNTDVLPQDALGKIVRSPIGGMIGVPAEAFHGEGAIKELPHGTMPRESFTSNDYIDADISRAGGVDASGAGVADQGAQTATAEQRQQSNLNARFDFERGVILDRYIQGVTKFAQLVMRWLPVAQAAQIVGPQRASYWDAWRKTVPAPIAFTAMPDSALRTDQAADRRQTQELYSYLANDPYAAGGRGKLLEKLLRKYHIDPTGIVSAPPPPKPEPPKLNLTFKGEDLVGPQAPIVLEILQQLGVTVNPQTVQTALAAQQQSDELQRQADVLKTMDVPADLRHGGKLPPQEPLDKHAAARTGGMQGSGAPAPLGQGGGLQ